jgi:hypothetical protein
MACVAYAAQIDGRFGDTVSEVLNIGIGVCPGNSRVRAFTSSDQVGWEWTGRLKP